MKDSSFLYFLHLHCAARKFIDGLPLRNAAFGSMHVLGSELDGAVLDEVIDRENTSADAIGSFEDDDIQGPTAARSEAKAMS